jgi:NhaP-type Na+/H+ or K+/H+ antiporter
VYADLALLALFILVYSAIAGRVERTWVSGPIVFAAFGLLIGPVGLDLPSFKADGETIRTLTELTLALITWVIFGSAVVGQALGHFSWQIWVYAALSLTVIRVLPVFVVLSGLGVSREGKLIMGWFGPR